MTDGELYEGLTEIFNDIFFRDDIALTPETTAKDIVGWDSMKQIEIILAAEERWSIKLTSKEIDGLRRVGDLSALIAAKAV
jgi:acyl carrier protein